jgi:ribosomal protein S18 acetylase RimI-like enzyme
METIAPHPADGITIVRTLASPAQRSQCAAILLDAFRVKIEALELFTRTPQQALRLLERGIQPEMGIYALREDQVLGVAGLQTRTGKFMCYPPAALRAEFGWLGGLLRQAWLGLMALGETPARSQLRISMLAVDPAARGSGVGTLLLQAVIDHARREGFTAVVLEVIDTNPGAQRLYERIGFRQVHRMQTAAITARAGFGGFIRMQLDL